MINVVMMKVGGEGRIPGSFGGFGIRYSIYLLARNLASDGVLDGVGGNWICNCRLVESKKSLSI